KHIPEHVDAVLIAIGAGKLENGKVHRRRLANLSQPAKSNDEIRIKPPQGAQRIARESRELTRIKVSRMMRGRIMNEQPLRERQRKMRWFRAFLILTQAGNLQ